MTMFIYRNLVTLSVKESPSIYNPHISFSLFSLFFSTSSSSSLEKKRGRSKRFSPVADYLIQHQNFSAETAAKVSSLVNHLRNPLKSDSVLSFLRHSGFSQTHLEHIIVRVPHLLSGSLGNTIKPKIELFQDLGFSSADIAEIFRADPWIFSRSLDNRLGPSILALKNIVGSNGALLRVLKIGWFLKHDLEKTLVPNVEFMKSYGVSSEQMVRFMVNFPRCLLLRPETIKENVRRVNELGFDMKSKMLLHAVRAISSMTVEKWEKKWEVLRSLGLSEDQTLMVFRRVPQVFAMSDKKIKESAKIMISIGQVDLSYIANHPDLLIYSVERRLKPRLRVVEILDSKNLLRKKPSLSALCKYSNKNFMDKFVLPYPTEEAELIAVLVDSQSWVLATSID